MKLNLGCGPNTPDGWVNVDYWIGSRLRSIPLIGPLTSKLFKIRWSEDIVLQDLTKRWQWADNSVDVVYSSHTIEHMWKEDGRHFMDEAFRVLKPEGIIRVVVPDLKAVVRRYLQGEVESVDFLDALDVFSYAKSESWHIRLLAPYFRFPHKCMYDLDAMVNVVENAGFMVTSTSADVSALDDIGAIELPNRVEEAVIVEAAKPAA